MSSRAVRSYYNENDQFAAAWLRELIADSLIPAGGVDERSIEDVQAKDLEDYTQCHFFAGIGGWPEALRLAGWPHDRPVWTGSCPCQPFSAAGKRLGVADKRHLWPQFLRLIGECRPAIVFGEQTASADGRKWVAGVRADPEKLEYGVGVADLCAAGIGAPHIRQRLWWVADNNAANGRLADTHGWHSGPERQQRSGQQRQQPEDGGVERLGDSDATRSGEHTDQRSIGTAMLARGVADAQDADRWRPALSKDGGRWPAEAGGSMRTCHWESFALLPCTDGKSRRVEPGTFPLVARLPAGVVPSGDPSIEEVKATAEARIGRLRGYGNSIVPQVAAEFIMAYMEYRDGPR